MERSQRWLEKAGGWGFKFEPFECAALHQLPVARRFLVFIDGTNNDPSIANRGRQTNVVRLHGLVDQREGSGQTAYYHEGVGSKTDEPNPVSGRLRHIGGKGVGRILDQVYLNIIERFQPGDEFLLFGFSRGATVARMLAKRLLEAGIPERGFARYHRLSKVARVKHQSDVRLDSVLPDPDSPRKPIERIEVLGLWDSVSSVGLLERLFEGGGPYLEVGAEVGRTYHLVSIDESRRGFAPTLVAPRDSVEEVWFPGVHCDVGGGYTEAGLANIALHFMKNRLVEGHGVRFLPIPDCPNCANVTDSECVHPECYLSNPRATAHEHSRWWPKKGRRVQVSGGLGRPRIHKSAFERLEAEDLKTPYRPSELLRLRESGAYELDDRD